MPAELLYDAKAYLGEGPVWDSHSQTLYWLDILNKRIFANADLLLQLDDVAGCFAQRKDGGFILALTADEGQRFSFAGLELDSDKLALISALENELPGNRFNDGKCDPRGRFIAGTMDLAETDATGSLYLFDGRSITKLLSGITVSNGLTWSPDHKTFYYIDTPTREVRAFDYDIESGAIANSRAAVYVHEALGWPDGMTSDTQGNLWIAMWGGAKVTKWDPQTGKLLEQIPVPALNVSSCIFGGKDLNELYITSARKGLDEAELARYPLTGGVFHLKTNVEGMPTFEFTG